jgi:Ser/Thr protein kinase RdoA (MazF antagonist)
VPVAWCAPRQIGRHVWCVFSRFHGTSRRAGGQEARERGRLLAELHQHLATLSLGQRPRWIQRAEVLGPQLEGLFRNRAQPDEAKVLLEYVERARTAFEEAGPLPAIVVHGDFTRGNLRYVRGRLSAILDFDFTHLDLRVADFTWPWGWQMCDDFVVGYEEVSPLDPVERAVMRPAFWVGMLEGARDWLLATDKQVSFVNTIATLRRRG